MKDELITFETAKLAKEKGFDELCYAFYGETGIIDNFYYDSVCSFDELLINNVILDRSIEHEKAYLAPTQSLLQRWLRVVHNMHCNIGIYDIISID